MVLVEEARRAGDTVLLSQRPAGEPQAPLRLSKFHAPEILFGHGSLSEAAHAAVRLGARRPFVVTDPGLLEAGWPAELTTGVSQTSVSVEDASAPRDELRAAARMPAMTNPDSPDGMSLTMKFANSSSLLFKPRSLTGFAAL